MPEDVWIMPIGGQNVMYDAAGRAIDDSFSGRRPIEDALAEYERHPQRSGTADVRTDVSTRLISRTMAAGRWKPPSNRAPPLSSDWLPKPGQDIISGILYGRSVVWLAANGAVASSVGRSSRR
jgi:hypothetical protein